jgi:BMFP domain-containing protein YqiC
MEALACCLGKEVQTMQTNNPLLDDLARVAAGALGTLTDVRSQAEARLRDQFERLLGRMDLVTREEFEAVKAMAAKARLEQEALERRLEALEARLMPVAAGEAPPPAPISSDLPSSTPASAPVDTAVPTDLPGQAG